MREIKFRVWDLGRNKWVEDWEDDFRYFFLNSSTFRPQQFTGLLDSKGIEIYEGDIVSFIQEAHEGFWDDYVSEVFYDEQLAAFVFGEELFGPLDRIRKLEVIGNIYENPELIKSPSD